MMINTQEHDSKESNIIFLINRPAHLFFSMRLIEQVKHLNFSFGMIIQNYEQMEKSRINNYFNEQHIKVIKISKRRSIFYGRNIVKHIYNSLRLRKILKDNFQYSSSLMVLDADSLSSKVCSQCFQYFVPVSSHNKKTHLDAYKKIFFKTFI